MEKTPDRGFVIGIDIGTTNIKGCLYSRTGSFLAKHSLSYKSFTPRDGYHEQDPEDWVNGVIEVLKNLLKYHDARENLQAIAFSNQGGTVIPVDFEYKPLGKAITWMDRRGTEVFERYGFLRDKNFEFYRRTGWRLDSHISFTPLYWIMKNRKSDFKRIHRILFVNDYVIYRITGNCIQDPSNASLTLLYNVKEGRWDGKILSFLDLSLKNMSEVKESGEIIGRMDDRISGGLGIKGDVLVINGGHDQYCTSIGAGLFKQEQTLLSTGTAWIIFKMLEKPLFDIKSFFAIGRNILKGKFGLLYSLPASGGSIKWFAEDLLNLKNEDELFKIIDLNKKRLKELRNNILYYPYLAGTFDPDLDQNAKGSFIGIDISNSYLDFIKAIMEGVTFHIKKVFLNIKDRGVETRSIKMVGGAVKNAIWTQIVADVLDMEIAVPENPEEDFAVKGAAIIANHGLNKNLSLYENYQMFQSDFGIIKPDKDNHRFYLNKYQDFEKNYKKIYLTTRAQD
jgi:sugar (pentulose or hexulose) kinase